MNKAVIGIIMTLAVNIIFAVRNFYGKNMQILLSLVACAIGITEYIFVFPSPAYIILIAFEMIYLVSYQFRRPLLRFFKVDLVFVLMLVLLAGTVAVSVVTYKGPDSLAGIVIIFLEMFAVYMLTAQGMRYKNAVVSLLYIIMDIGAGNFFAIAMDGMNLITPIIAIFKNKGELLLDKEMLTENVELVKITKEIRKLRRSSR